MTRLTREMLRRCGLSDFEIDHAIFSGGVSYDDEAVVDPGEGRQMRCPASPDPCSYVRITQEVEADLTVELAYWTSDEWRESPEEVMGAIIGALMGGRRRTTGRRNAGDGEGAQGAALRAILALLDGRFDDPWLMATGPLMADRDESIRSIIERAAPTPPPDLSAIAESLNADQKRYALEAFGFTLGPRLPGLNVGHEGHLMVVEADAEELSTTTDNSGGDPWCVVGGDLDALIEEAFDYLLFLDSDDLPRVLIEAASR
ncbi:hypothetical protein [Falsiroseomonas sp. CW058]|uniref:hypothetical protein n=1 Tax=Falsiroseomonas sp. CW058 TaxID=3388664 RepID=UPI003D321AF5